MNKKIGKVELCQTKNAKSKTSITEKELSKMMGLAGVNTSERMVLEPRILLDAAGMETADTVSDQIAIEQAENWQTPILEDDITANIRAISDADEVQENRISPPTEIVFIDSALSTNVTTSSTKDLALLNRYSSELSENATINDFASDEDIVFLTSNSALGEAESGSSLSDWPIDATFDPATDFSNNNDTLSGTFNGNTVTFTRTDSDTGSDGTLTLETGNMPNEIGLGRTLVGGAAVDDSTLGSSEDYLLTFDDAVDIVAIQFGFLNNNIDGAEELTGFIARDADGNIITDAVFRLNDESPAGEGLIFRNQTIAPDFVTHDPIANTSVDIVGVEGAGGAGTQGILEVTSATSNIVSVEFARTTTRIADAPNVNNDNNKGALGVLIGSIQFDPAQALDTDGDGVADEDDVDDDNDGILDILEGGEVIEGFTIGAVTLAQNGDGSGTFTIPIIDGLGNEAGTLTLDYFGFNGDGDGQGGNGIAGGAPRNFIPTLEVGELNGEIAVQLRYAVPDVDGHNFGYSITSNGLNFTDVQYNLQGPVIENTTMPGRTEGGAFTFEHNLDNDPIVTNNPLAESHQIDGVTVQENDALANGTVVDRVNRPTNIGRFFDVDFALGDSQSFGINAIHDARSQEGIESASFSLRTAVVIVNDTDFDSDGIVDRLDIDSDNDGITDNIEAQTTTGFIAPSGIGADITDINMDGLDDNFDNRSVSNGGASLTVTDASAGFAEAQIIPVNSDGQDNPDFQDLDSDNEGGNDTVEAGIGTEAATGLSNASNDADGDGLFDVFDGQNGTGINDGFDVNESITTGAFALPDSDDDAAMGASLTADVDFRDTEDNTDTDDDGIEDSIDIDDDNDGILDVDEVPASSNGNVTGLVFDTASSGFFFESTEALTFGGDPLPESTADNTTDGITSSSAANGAVFQTDDGEAAFVYTLVLGEGQTADQFELYGLVGGSDFESVRDYDLEIIDTTGAVVFSGSASSPTGIGANSLNLTGFSLGEGAYTVRITVRSPFLMDAASTRTDAELAEVRFTNNGTPLTFSGATSAVVIAGDSDNDGIFNHLDIDSDNDGITDNIEAQSTADYIAPSGIENGITDVNSDGLDDNYGGVFSDVPRTSNAFGSLPNLFYDHNGPAFPGELEANNSDGHVVSGSAISYGAGLTPSEVANSTGLVGTGHATLAEALAADAYVEVSFTTADDPASVLALSSFTTFGPRFDGTLAIFLDGELVDEITLSNTGTSFQDFDFTPRIQLENDTTHQVRFVIYGAPNSVVIDSYGLNLETTEYFLSPVDTVNDGTVDFLDTDSDNEGGNDTVEAGLGANVATGLSDASTDADGDGLFDVFDAQNGTDADDGFDVNEFITTGAASLPDSDGDAAGGVPLSADVDFRDAQEGRVDTDGDGVFDEDDVDDDNDGILDTAELRDPPLVTRISSAAGTINWTGDTETTLTTITNMTRRASDFARAVSGFVETTFDDPVEADEIRLSAIDLDVNANNQNYRLTLVVTGEATTQDFVLENPAAGITYDPITGIVNVPANLTNGGGSNVAVAFVGIGDASVDSVRLSYAGGGGGDLVAIRVDGVSVLLDTDSDGISNHLDIDSDNDGITDNIEAQATGSYVAPSGVGSNITDVNQDGLDDNYDDRIVTAMTAAATEGVGNGGGLMAVDTDRDGTVDNRDTDSDNDGDSDAVEAGLGAIATGLSNMSNDADGDGLFDVFETQNGTTTTDGFNVNESLDAGAISFPDSDNDAALGVALLHDVDFRDALADPDTDGDGISDVIDIDDDNDGVLDSIENIGVTSSQTEIANVIELASSSTTAQASLTVGNETVDVNFAGTDVSFGTRPITSPNVFSILAPPAALLPNLETTFDSEDAVLTIDFDGNFLVDPILYLFYEDGSGEQFDLGVPFTILDRTDPGIIQQGTSLVFNGIGAIAVQLNGAFNSLDIIYDDIGFGSSLTLTSLLGTSQILTADADRDADGILNSLDIDSDNDGITDNIEAQTTNSIITPSGTGDPDNGGTFVDANRDGLDDSFDSRTSLDVNSAAATSAEALINPVDTDNDGDADFIDTDADDDGIADVAERGDDQTTDSQVSVISDATTDADGDGLLDVFEGTDDDDGFDVNDENITTADGATLVSLSEINLSADPQLQDDLSNVDGTIVNLSFRDNDTDNDGVADDVDVDDDNDGILDVDEQVETLGSNLIADGGFVDETSAAAEAAGFTFGAFASVSANAGLGLTGGLFEEIGAIDGLGAINIATNGTAPAATVDLGQLDGAVHQFAFDVENNSATPAADLLLVTVHNTTTDMQHAVLFNQTLNGFAPLNDPQTVSGSFIIPEGSTDTFELRFHGLGNGNQPNDYRVDRIAIAAQISSDVDTDNDGIVDRLDIDSDNDGITDNIEAQATGGITSTVAISPTSGNTGSFTLNGVDNSVEFSTDTGAISTSGDFFRYGEGTTAQIGTTYQFDFDEPVDRVSLVFDNVFQNGTIGNFTVIYTDGKIQDNLDVAISSAAAFSPGSQDMLTREVVNGVISVADNNLNGTSTAAQAAGLVEFLGLDTSSGIVSISWELISIDTGQAFNALVRPIVDNVGYIAPSGTVNSQGLDIAYEGTNGLTPVDTDSDGVTDVLDTNSDNDGLTDAQENGFTENGIQTGLSDNMTDTDGDGLFDVFEDGTPNDGFIVNDGMNPSTDLPDGDNDAAEGVLLTADFDFRDVQDDTDTDGDGVRNEIDVDDDNDGILDVDEGLGTDSFSPDSTILTRAGVDTDVAGVETILQENDVIRYGNSITINGQSIDVVLTLLEFGNLDGNGEITLSSNSNPTIFVGDNVNQDPFVRYSIELVESGTNTAVTLQSPANLLITDVDSGAGLDISEVFGVQTGVAASVALGDFVTSGNFVNGATVPTDFDYYTVDPTDFGDPTNFLDEGNTPRESTNSDINLTLNNFSSAEFVLGSTGTFTGDNGVNRGFRILDFNVVTDRDSDNDGIADHLDIDSDDDGITDNIEAQSTVGYIAPSGTGNGITDVNQDGLDDIYDTRNGTLTASDAAATSAEAVIDPVNTDELGNPDFLNLDSDNDGILDINENGLSVTFVAGDTDGDGLADIFETAIDGNANDGFIVNEGVTDPLNAPNDYLPDSGGDASVGTPTPLINDLDFRDPNDDPIAENDPAATGLVYETDENTPLSIAIANGVLSNDSDPDNNTLTVTRVASGTDATVLATAMDGDGVATTVAGSNGGLITINAVGSIDFDPNGEFEALNVGESETTSVAYQVSDGNSGTDTAVATFTINGINDAPIAQDDIETTNEDTVLSDNVLQDNGNGADSDVESQPLTVMQVNGVEANVGMEITLASGALLTVNPDGTYDYDPNGQFESLAVGETGMDSFTYQISDGNGGFDAATVSITVDGVNDAPIVVDPNNPGTPPADPNAIVPMQLGEDGSDITLLDISDFFDDTDDTVLTFSLSPDAPSWLVIDEMTGEITGTPPADASVNGPMMDGVYPVTIIASDPNGETASTKVIFDISNPAPIAEDDLVTTNEDTNLLGNVLIDNTNGVDTDPDGDMLIISQVGGSPVNLGQPVPGTNGGSFIVTPDGSFEFIPSDDFNGLGVGETALTEVQYEVSDGEGGTDTATITVTVAGANDGPIPVDPSQPPIDPENPPVDVLFDPQTPFAPPLDPENYIPEQIAEDSAPITPIDLTPFFGDPDTNDYVVITIVSDDLPEGLVFDPLTNTISGVPTSDASQGGNPLNPGTYIIPVTATDESGETFTTNVTFVISNPAPTVSVEIEDFTETVGNNFETETADNFEDIDGDDLTFSAEGLPAGLSIDPVTGIISGQLDPAAVVDAPNSDGIYTVTVTVDDGQGGTVSDNFVFTALDAFIPVNEEPEQDLVVQTSQLIEPETSVPFILQALDEFDDEREKRMVFEQAFFDVDENGFPLNEYRGGHQSVETIAGNTIIKTFVSKDSIYLEVRSQEALNGWKVVNEGDTSAWEAYENANLFVSMPSVSEKNSEVILQNEQLGIEVRIRIDFVSGKFDVLETRSLDQEQASLNSFSKQLQNLNNQYAIEARNLLKALG